MNDPEQISRDLLTAFGHSQLRHIDPLDAYRFLKRSRGEYV